MIAVSLIVGGGVRLIKPVNFTFARKHITNTTRTDTRRRVCAAMVPLSRSGNVVTRIRIHAHTHTHTHTHTHIERIHCSRGSRTTKTSTWCESCNATWQASHEVATFVRRAVLEEDLVLLSSHQRGVVKKEQPYDVCNFYGRRRGLTNGALAVRLWLRTSELQGERRYENRNTTTTEFTGWTDARRPVPLPWIRSAEVVGDVVRRMRTQQQQNSLA